MPGDIRGEDSENNGEKKNKENAYLQPVFWFKVEWQGELIKRFIDNLSIRYGSYSGHNYLSAYMNK